MKKLILPLAGLALTLAVAPGYAAQSGGQGGNHQSEAVHSGGSYGESCAAILADKAGHTRGEVRACE